MDSKNTERFAGLVLAAGLSRRAGTLKPAIEVAGRSLLAHAVDGLLQRCGQVVVVVGHEAKRVADLVAGRPEVKTVLNAAYEEDMFRSVQAGVGALPETLDGFFILPVDCPLVSAEVLEAMVLAFDTDPDRHPVVPVHAGRGGHPVLLSANARESILEAGPPANLRTILQDLQARRITVASDTIHLDLDTPEDLARWLALIRNPQDEH